MSLFRKYLGAVLWLCFGFVSVAEISTVSVVEKAHPGDVRYEQRPWIEQDDGGLFSDKLYNVLYADAFIGSGDFYVKARLVIDDLNGSDAAFVMNEYNFFGFSGYEGRLYVKGRMLGTKRLDASATDLIEPGEPFDFVAERAGDLFRISINGQQVFETPFVWRWGGEFGFRCLQVLDFSVTANFLPVEEYVMNSPFFGADTGPLEIAPVVLPEGENLVDNNWHFGWPIATKAGDAMVVVFQRTQHHHGSARPGLSSRSTGVAVRSMDGGETWSDAFDLKSAVKKGAEHNPGGMRAICTSSKGTIVYIGDMGAFRSEDQGQTWTHYPDAFPEVNREGVINHNIGPDILEDGQGHLIAFSHVVTGGMTFPNRLWLWISDDDGRSWTHREVALPESFHAVEPAVCIVDGMLYMLARYHHPQKAFNPETGLYNMMQMVLPVGEWENAVARVTNIHTTDAVDVLAPLCGAAKAQSFGFWSQDTPDLSYNPVTKRLEAVVTNRTGGGTDEEQDITKQTLNLWSIDPADFRDGIAQWRFEGTLLERYTMDVPKFFDGMHPAGSVIDEANGVQHIFIYAGYYHGPTGVFRITRPLNTSVVRTWWESIKQQKSEEANMKARKYFATLGMAAALTGNVPAELVKEGLILQLDGSSMEMDGREGVAWTDLSGSGHDLKVPSGSDGCKLDKDGLNDLPVVEFDNDDKNRWQLDASRADTFNPGAGGMTFFVVCRPENFDRWQALIRKGNYKSSDQEGYSIAAIQGGDGRFVTRAATAKGDKTGVQSAFTGKSSDFSLYVSSLTGTESAAWLNGAEAVPFGPKTAYAGSIDPPDSLFVGIDFTGEIAEILIYNRALSVDEINSVSAYLTEKYALNVPMINKVD